MRRFWFIAAMAGFTSFPTAAFAETYTLTLKQAIARALTQNPDMLIARLDEARSKLGVKVAEIPFSPRVGVGSGIAYSTGFPLSIEGSAPAVFQARANQYIFNRAQSYAVQQAKENARGAGIVAEQRRDEVVFRTASLYIDVDRSGRLADAAQKQIDSLTNTLESLTAAVQLGKELPVTMQESNLNVLRAQQRQMLLQADREYGEHALAVALGYGAVDSVRPAAGEREQAKMPDTEEAALQMALEGNRELSRLESAMRANGLEIKSYAAQRLPSVDLVAQYALLTKYSHYDEYFQRFQRNNGQIGASIQVPLFWGSAVKSQVQQAENGGQRIRAELQALRNRIALDVQQSFQEIAKANMAAQVAKAEVDLAHSRLSILLAQMNEGRATVRQVEEARSAEDDRWVAFLDARFGLEKARLNILKQTGQLLASLQ